MLIFWRWGGVPPHSGLAAVKERRRLTLRFVMEMTLGSEPTSYERCLDSAINDVLNHDTLSSTHYFPSSGVRRIGVVSPICLVLIERTGQIGGSLALKLSSIAFAPRLSAGRNSLRYPFSVVRVVA
jgi:hypothetical protein